MIGAFSYTAERFDVCPDLRGRGNVTAYMNTHGAFTAKKARVSIQGIE